jgi:hypothetical protein
MSHFYVAGPMSGYKGFNFEAFILADKILLDAGHTTFNPAVHEISMGIVPYPEILDTDGDFQELIHLGVPFDKRKALRRDMLAIADSEGVVLLDGWEKSSGAFLEALAATWIDLPLFRLADTDMGDGSVVHHFYQFSTYEFNLVAERKYRA